MAGAGMLERLRTEPLSIWWYVGVGAIWFAANAALGATGVDDEAPYLWVAAGSMSALGLLCWWNGRNCGSLHCRISGPGYIGVAALGAVAAVGIVPLRTDLLFGLFWVVVLAAFGAEWIVERRAASAG